MILSSVELNNFRNYEREIFEFDSSRNVILGKNAQGKSNLLEAIYLLCLTRSFRTRKERETIKFNKTFASIAGKFVLDNGQEKNIVYYFTPDKGKQVSVNRKRVEKLSEIIGNFPVVISSPEAYNLTSGAPADRRKFLDILLSQISNQYILNLQEYNKIIKQRNAILNKYSHNRSKIISLIQPWDEYLIEKGSWLIRFRDSFLKTFNVKLRDVHSMISVPDETIKLTYQSTVDFENSDDVKPNFRKKLEAMKKIEIEQGNTIIGPHRDDILFFINDKELRKYGSRGQHKTVLIAIMISEFQLIIEKIHETPIILIDDLFSEIDHTREDKILSYILDLGQNFISTTLDYHEALAFFNKKRAHLFELNNGMIFRNEKI
ncbi:DNA replication/repair protein RecF [candidate division KSB1 bacterium]|nr:DNA replication/repair protein RecF [candidate division KSB1 bacterium]